MTTAPGITQIQPVIHGSITAAIAENCTLSLVFYKSLVVFVIEDQHNSIKMYGQIPFDHYSITETGIRELDDTSFFGLKYRKVWTAISNSQYSIVPSSLHKRDLNQEYLSFCLGHEKQKFSCIRQDYMFTLDIVMVYNMTNALEKYLLRKHPGVSIRHEKSVLADKGPALSRSIGDLMLINLSHEHFDILLTRNGNIIFLNSFPMQNTDEILYYIFDVLKQLNCSLAEFQVRFCGLNPSFMQSDLILKYIPSLRDKIIPETVPATFDEPATYFTAYHLAR